MIRVALVGAWPLLVIGAGWRFGPRRQPVLATADRQAEPPPAPRRRRRRRTAGLVVVTVAFALLHPVLAPVPGLVVLALPRHRAVRARRRAQAAVIEELPDVVDLLVLAAGAGLTAVLAAEAVGRRSRGPVGGALAEVSRRIALGETPVAAFHDLPEATSHPDVVRPLARGLVTAVEEGVPLEPVLRRVSTEARERRRRAAEEAARRVPVRLLFPLVACTLPAFVVLTVVPLLVVGLDSLDL